MLHFQLRNMSWECHVSFGGQMQVTQSSFSTARGAHHIFLFALGVLLATDLFFMVMHVVNNDKGWFWSVGQDRSFSERYQYLKAAAGAGILLTLYWQRRSLTYLGWGMALLFILVDDAFFLHERFTDALLNASAPTILGLNAHDYGAMVLWAVVGLVLLLPLGLGYLRDPATRRFSRRFFVILMLLFLCGGVVDTVRELADDFENPLLRYVFMRTILVEDGGELIMVSFFAALSLKEFLVRNEHFRRSPNAPDRLHR